MNQTARRPFRLLACSLAGKEHHDFADNISEVGDSALTLAPEPENPHDNTAVAVFLPASHNPLVGRIEDRKAPRKLGYLARGPLQKLVFLLLSNGYRSMAGKLQPSKVNSQKWDIVIWMHPANEE